MATALRGAVVPVAIVARGVGNEAIIAWPARHVTCHVTRIVAGSNQDTSRVQPVIILRIEGSGLILNFHISINTA